MQHLPQGCINPPGRIAFMPVAPFTPFGHHRFKELAMCCFAIVASSLPLMILPTTVTAQVTTRTVVLQDGGSGGAANTITLQPPSSTGLAANYSLTLPTGLPPGSGYLLSAGTDGVCSWAQSVGSSWLLNGNAITAGGTAAGESFLGTTNAQPLVIATSGSERLRVTSTGDMLIGTTTSNGRLTVDRTTTATATAATLASFSLTHSPAGASSSDQIATAINLTLGPSSAMSGSLSALQGTTTITGTALPTSAAAATFTLDRTGSFAGVPPAVNRLDALVATVGASAGNNVTTTAASLRAQASVQATAQIQTGYGLVVENPSVAAGATLSEYDAVHVNNLTGSSRRAFYYAGDPGSNNAPVVVESDGDVGIGLAAPTARLDVRNTFTTPTTETFRVTDNQMRVELATGGGGDYEGLRSISLLTPSVNLTGSVRAINAEISLSSTATANANILEGLRFRSSNNAAARSVSILRGVVGETRNSGTISDHAVGGDFAVVNNGTINGSNVVGVGLRSTVTHQAATTATNLQGVSSTVVNQSGGTITNAIGMLPSVQNSNGTISNAYLLQPYLTNNSTMTFASGFSPQVLNIGSGVAGSATIGTLRLMELNNPTNIFGGAITTLTGLYIQGLTAGSSNTAIHYAHSNAPFVVDGSGNVGIGLSNPVRPLQVEASGSKTGNFTTASIANTATSTTGGVSKVGIDIQATGGWSDGNGATNEIVTGVNVTVGGGQNNYAATLSGGSVGIGTTAPTTLLHTLLENGTTNAMDPVMTVGHRTSGTVAAGFGSSIAWELESSTTNDRDAGRIGVQWTTATDASRSSAMTFWTVDNAAAIGERVRIEGDGDVGIGTTTPGARLDVEQSGGVVARFNRTTNDGTLVSLVQDGSEEGTITVSGNTVSYNAFTGSHYAWSEEPIELGMVVRLTGKNRRLHNRKQSEILYGIATTQHANERGVIGAYLSLQEPKQNASADNPHLVMAVGNGEMWVTDQGGAIEPGDDLITASLPGHAMRDNGLFDTSYVVARAAEPVDWSTIPGDPELDGIKHKRISVLFEYSTRINGPNTELQQLRALVDKLTQRVSTLEQESASRNSPHDKKPTIQIHTGM